MTILGKGSGLVGGTIKAKLRRDDLEKLLADGFLPSVASTEMPARQHRVGLQELGLPYAADAAITRHLARFLRQQASTAEHGGVRRGPSGLAAPTHVLFNGGVLNAATVRDRLLSVLNAWLAEEGMPAVQLLTGEDLMHAVSRGAAYYGLARCGKGVRIHGGVPRTYYVGVESAMPSVPGLPAPLKALTVVPFGMEEGSRAAHPQPRIRPRGRRAGRVPFLRLGGPQERPARRPHRGFRRRPRRAFAHGSQPPRRRKRLRSRPRLLRSRRHRNRHAAVVVCGPRRPPLETGIQRPRARHAMKIGIDLGTTNSALAYIDDREAQDRDFPPIHIFEVPQLVAAGRTEPRRMLPSFLFLEDGQPVGEYAREQGALVPTRLVHSAKSWLSNPDVDRTAKILPWDSQETGRVLSPVEVSARFLAQFRESWDAAKQIPLAEQDIVLTVPASFDEEARELTVMAANEAGLPKLTLLEEPAAAFYSWIAHDLAQSRKLLFDGQIVLVCDVGGGTSDFSLIRVTRQGDLVDFTRTAVGKHLLLGGDNLDLTLGWLVETKLGVPLSVRQRSGLRRQCSSAKERLLTDPNLKSVEVTVLGTGSALIGRSLKTEILREEALELALAGFLPVDRARRFPQGGKTQPVPRAGPALCRRPFDHPSPERISRGRQSSSGCDSLQRRLLHSRSAAPARGRRGRALVRETAADLREPRSGPGGRHAARLTTHTCARPAAAYSCAAACPGPTTSASAKTPRCAWCRAAPKRVRRWRSTTEACSLWPTSRSRSGSTAR